MNILAIDLGKFNSMCCFFDTENQKHTFLNVATTRGYLTTVFKQHSIDLVVMEACGPSGWISDLCEELGLKTLVCSTNEEALAAENLHAAPMLNGKSKIRDSNLKRTPKEEATGFLNKAFELRRGQTSFMPATSGSNFTYAKPQKLHPRSQSLNCYPASIASNRVFKIRIEVCEAIVHALRSHCYLLSDTTDLHSSRFRLDE